MDHSGNSAPCNLSQKMVYNPKFTVELMASMSTEFCAWKGPMNILLDFMDAMEKPLTRLG